MAWDNITFHSLRRSRALLTVALVVDTRARTLSFLVNNKLVEVYPIAVGKPSTPTPKGKWQIVSKIVNPGGILGSRWLGLNVPWGNYGIHGTNNPSSIGKAISNGCIRMFNHHIEDIFPFCSIGTPVHTL